MTYRMMGGCLEAAWDGPHRAAYASPAVGGPSHVQAFAWGRCRNPTKVDPIIKTARGLN